MQTRRENNSRPMQPLSGALLHYLGGLCPTSQYENLSQNHHTNRRFETLDHPIYSTGWWSGFEQLQLVDLAVNRVKNTRDLFGNSALAAISEEIDRS
jgi:hypothetical protein